MALLPPFWGLLVVLCVPTAMGVCPRARWLAVATAWGTRGQVLLHGPLQSPWAAVSACGPLSWAPLAQRQWQARAPCLPPGPHPLGAGHPKATCPASPVQACTPWGCCLWPPCPQAMPAWQWGWPTQKAGWGHASAGQPVALWPAVAPMGLCGGRGPQLPALPPPTRRTWSTAR